MLQETIKVQINTNNIKSSIAKKCYWKMSMFKEKLELIPVTTGYSYLSKNENLCTELCRTVLAEPFYIYY